MPLSENGSGLENETMFSGPVLRSEWECSLCGSILTLICMSTVAGNAIVILVLLKSWHNTVNKPGNYLVLHLALADVLNGLLTMPLGCTSYFSREWLFGDSMCKVSAFLLIFFTTASNSFLSMISLNRYYRVRYPSVRVPLLRRRAFLMTMMCWLLGLICAVASAIDWGIITFVPGLDVICLVRWDTSPKSLVNMLFVGLLLFFLPFAIMVVTYIRIYRLVRSRRTQVEAQPATGIVDRITTNRPSTIFQQVIANSTEKRTAVTLSIVLGIFAICWNPVIIVQALRTFRGEIVSGSVQSVAIILMYLSPAINPVVYSLRNRSFRAEITDLFTTQIIHEGGEAS